MGIPVVLCTRVPGQSTLCTGAAGTLPSPAPPPTCASPVNSCRIETIDPSDDLQRMMGGRFATRTAFKGEVAGIKGYGPCGLNSAFAPRAPPVALGAPPRANGGPCRAEWQELAESDTQSLVLALQDLEKKKKRQPSVHCPRLRQNLSVGSRIELPSLLAQRKLK